MIKYKWFVDIALLESTLRSVIKFKANGYSVDGFLPHSYRSTERLMHGEHMIAARWTHVECTVNARWTHVEHTIAAR